MSNVFDVLKERGFFEQMTHEKEIKELLGRESVTFYVGFDPTAESMTIGHFIPVMAMIHMQRAGHKPIAVLGGGTGMIGDPTDKTEMRKMMFEQEITKNCDGIKAQLSKYLDFSDGKGYAINNADWLSKLEYIPFIREVGIHFSVNRMLAAECYKNRMEKGLSFLEFNYMIMQSYDFLRLYKTHGCKLQMGGNDQWSNIIGGVELIRRSESGEAFGMTFSLLTTSEGVKMGKSLAGAIWVDANRTSPYDFFQYFRNIEDSGVKNCLSMLTFLPMDEVERLSALPGSEINKAKEILAYEITKIIHGEEEADKALAAAKALFSGAAEGGSIPKTEISVDKLGGGLAIIDALELCSLIPTRSEGRRLIQQGGISVGGKKITEFDHLITKDDFVDNKLMIQKGKKIYHQLIFTE